MFFFEQTFQTVLNGIVHLGSVRNAAIASDKKLGSIRGREINSLGIKAITFGFAMRNVNADAAAQFLDRAF